MVCASAALKKLRSWSSLQANVNSLTAVFLSINLIWHFVQKFTFCAQFALLLPLLLCANVLFAIELSKVT